MTSAPDLQAPAAARAPTAQATDGGPSRGVRLRLKPKVATTGSVGGGWWPHSRDLGVELAALLEVLAVRLGRIERVRYHLGDWDAPVSELRAGGGVVRLRGYRVQHLNTLDVISAEQRVTLFVVPPETPPRAAREALRSAGRCGSTDDLGVLLVSSRVRLRTQRAVAVRAARQR